MTDTTRRHMLLLTAAAAVATSSSTYAATDTSKLNLLVPNSPIADGSAIPIGIKIPAEWWKAYGIDIAQVDRLDMTLTVDKAPVATLRIRSPAMPPAGVLKAIELSTRIRIAVDANKSPRQSTLELNLTAYDKDNKALAGKAPPGGAAGTTLANASATLTVRASDCSSAGVSLLRVSLQPPVFQANEAVILKAMVPEPQATKGAARPKLKGMTVKIDESSQPAFELADIHDELLAAEVFTSLSLFPAKTGVAKIEWSYDDTQSLIGSARLIAKA